MSSIKVEYEVSEEVSYKTVSVVNFVDVVIIEYTDYESLREIDVLFTIDNIKRNEKYTTHHI